MRGAIQTASDGPAVANRQLERHELSREFRQGKRRSRMGAAGFLLFVEQNLGRLILGGHGDLEARRARGGSGCDDEPAILWDFDGHHQSGTKPVRHFMRS
jgi:hypothetical protein